MNMTEWRLGLIASGRPAAIPVMTHPGIEQTGHTVREAVTSGAVHAEAVRWIAHHYPSAAASVIMDLTVEAEAFGAHVVFPDDEIPSVTGRLLSSSADIARLEVPSLSRGRVPEYLRAVAIAHRDITDRPLLAGCIGPFSLAGRLYDMSEIMVLTVTDPVAAHELLSKCTLYILRYITALRAAGADGVLMAEPAAGLLSDKDCRTFSSDYVRQIVEATDDDRFLVVLHNCGNTGHCTPAMLATGAHALHLGNRCSLADVAAQAPRDTLVMGNLDPVGIFQQATPDIVRQATRQLRDETRQYPNVVLSSGCDTPPHTPLANIDAFFEALRD